MTWLQFNKQLGIITLVSLAVSALLAKFEPFEDAFWISVTTILLFAVLTLVLYYLGISTANSPNKNLFLIVAVGSIFVKLVLVLLILFSYRAMYAPEGRNYLFPFISIYLVYTIFETYVLMRLSKTKD